MIFKPSLVAIAFAAGVAAVLGIYWYGYFEAASDYKKIIADGQAKFARRIGAANAQTRATAARLSTRVQQSEAKIDELTKRHQDELAKLPNTCILSDDDMLRLWNGGSGNSRTQSSTRPRVRQTSGQAATP